MESWTTEDRQKKREAAIREKLTRISKEHKLKQANELPALQDLVTDATNETQHRISDLKKRRAGRTRFGKSGYGLQKLTSSLSNFLGVYSGIVGLSNAADAQYGGTTWWALSLLMQIGANKEIREATVISAFDELAASWIGPVGRLNTYREAYRTIPEMNALIGDVYLGIGELAVDSQEYYLQPSYVRLWHAISRPPQLSINQKVDDIKKAIWEVVSEGNTRLNMTVSQLQRDITEVKGTVDGRVENSQKKEEQTRLDRLTKLSGKLSIDPQINNRAKFMAKCETLYVDAFATSVRSKGRSKLLQQISIAYLKNFNLYDSWRESTESSVLVLSGYNYDLYTAGHHLCWLSPAAIEIAEEQIAMQVPNVRNKIAFFSACRDEETRFGKSGDHLADCFSHIIWQILHWDNEYFADQHQWIKDAAKAGDWHICPLPQRKAVLKRLLEGLPSTDQIYIIVDRIDCIKPLDDNVDEDRVSGILEALLETMCEAPCRVKLMITVEDSEWAQVKKDSDLKLIWKTYRQRHVGLRNCSLYCKIGWQQPEKKIW